MAVFGRTVLVFRLLKMEAGICALSQMQIHLSEPGEFFDHGPGRCAVAELADS